MQIKTTIKIPSEYNLRATQSIAEDVLDYIVNRTKEGKGKDGKSFPGYSESYKNSLDFLIAGKDGTVDLTLTGEMLDSLKVLSVDRGQIEIGFEEGDEVNGRAEGNILGSYGGDPDPKKARNFLDISDKEVSSILIDYPIDDARERLTNIGVAELARVLARDIVSRLDFDLEGDDEG